MMPLKKQIAVLLAVSMAINIIPFRASADEYIVIEEPQKNVDTTEEELPASEETQNDFSYIVENQDTDNSEMASAPLSGGVSTEKNDESAESESSAEAEEQIILELSLLEENSADTLFSDPFANQFSSVLSDAGYTPESIITEDANGVVTLTIGDGQGVILELLSKQPQTADTNYQNWNIKFSFTGNLALSSDYHGLGDPDFPFTGKFTDQSITISSSKTIFKALGAQADLNSVKIEWTGTPDIPVLTDILIADDSDHTISMSLSQSKNFSPFIGQLTGRAGTVTLSSLDYSSVKESPPVEYPGDVGLVCCSMDAGTKLQIGTLILPSQVSVNLRGTAAVGGLAGNIGDDAVLTVTQSLNLNATLQGQNTGGLAGSLSNAAIQFGEDVSVSVSADLTAAKSAGGIAGVCVTVTGPLESNANVTLQSVKANGTENSGVLYGSCTAAGDFRPFAGVSFAENAVKEVSGPGSCGGVFGTLTLNEDGKCSIETAGDSNPEISSILSAAENTTAYGGVAGTLEGGARKHALVVDECSITSDINVGTDSTSYPQYIGGIVARQETATVDAKNSTITVNNPKTKAESDRGFGGLSAYVGDGALLIADTMTVKTDSYITNKSGGGAAGSVHKGSIVYLKNRLDLSECLLPTNAFSGQIVGYQDCSLVYAPGVNIFRLKTGSYDGMELDDIGNYGELYRVADFLNVDDDYNTNFLRTLNKTDEVFQLSDALDYACLALAWQSRGWFSTVDGIDSSTWSRLKSCTIHLSADLDLTGCGIGGLTRDVNSADDTFSGEFIGNNHKVILDIGADHQANETKVSKGDGRIYWHNATGLFAVLSGEAKMRNLTLAGSVRISNNKLSLMESGGLAALLSSDSESAQIDTIQKVSTEVSFDVVRNGGNPLYVGGLFGLISKTKQTTLNFTSDTNLGAQITVTNSGDGIYNHIGGAIGAIGTDAKVDIVCDGVNLGGSIRYRNTSNNIYAGGLVGTVFPSSSVKRTIAIKHLTVDGFSLTGSAKERMGGILGGIWADTDVAVDGLTVNEATLTASGTAALGGLVYRASGKWTVSSADLSGLTINASQAKALGILVCQGGFYKEPINTTSSFTNIDGLYLEMTEHWDWNTDTQKGYHVPCNITFDGVVFDEFVACTAYADRDSNTPDYQITANGSGIISLKTENDTVNMTEGGRNTYVNRTAVGQSQKTNLYSRYYYNLSKVKSECNGGEIDTAQELLLWSVYRYAASNLQQYFTIDHADMKTGTIGGTSETVRASFDMKGLSYYPINLTNTDVTVQYADVRFCNDDIETKEAGNKLTRGDAESHSQHYTMHCALFLDYTADLKHSTEYKNRTMTVNGVTFSGSVGVINGGSGALICGTVQGDTRGGNSSICTVTLADADDAGKAVLLDGLSVVPEGDYTPALIHAFGSYVGLKANYVSATEQQTMTAGSSLIGDVGGQGAASVSVEFAGTIKLPESGVFTRATLLNSLRYENGSATYRFYKNKDYDASNAYLHNTTHGQELSTTVEYASKQGCYYDAYGAGYYVSSNGNFDSQNDFTEYLPYVAFSPAASGSTHPLAGGWHELAVNVLSSDLTEGCGTYGHPYQIDANLLKEAANYINTGRASEGWQVRVSVDDETYHTAEGEQDVLLTYTADGWMAGENLYTGNVQQYLANAYFEIKESIELTDFNGIGTDGSGQGLPFTGVIKGKNADTTVTLSGGSTAFIKYSYGSVVRDLTIVLNQSPTLNRETWIRGTAEQAPKTFFGGVIGCVLGGDNIIENVTVSKGTEFNYTLTGTGTHLVPVGGYIGVIAGGGVIFRGSCSDHTAIAGTDAQLYRNPIIGRVLGGYAFYEGSETAPDNGDKNYKINTIAESGSATSDLSWDGSKVTVNNAQGLLLLSAIVSSGAGSKSSNAYAKGKARNAVYDQIGADTEPADYAAAKKDAGAVWDDSNTNTPYLLCKYADYTGSAEICSGGTEGIAIEFAKDAAFDMTGYDNGYRGLSARYVSNAAFCETNGLNSVDASKVVLRVSAFDGKNADVQNINMNVKEYADDDFHAASLGGIFNIIWTKKQSGGNETSIFAQNLTLTNCKVSLQYIDKNGGVQKQADTATFADADGLSCVTVGGFIGSVSDTDINPDMTKVTSNYLFKNIHIIGNEDRICIITGPNSAGGLIGASAMTNSTVKGCPGVLLSNSKNTMFGPNFLNCSYSNIKVKAKLAAGGLAGYVFAGSSTGVPQFTSLGISNNNNNKGCYASCTVTVENFTEGNTSEICAEARRGVAGGVFGAAGMRVLINAPNVNSQTGLSVPVNEIQMFRLLSVTVKSSIENEYIVRGDGSTKNGPTPNTANDDAAAAGIIGRIGSVNPTCFYDISLEECTIKTGKWNNEQKIINYEYAGGIVGYGYTNTSITIQRCQVNNSGIDSKNSGGFLGYGYMASGFILYMSDCKIEDSTVNGNTYSGGLVGKAASKYNLFNILIKNTSITGPNTGRLFGWMNINATGDDFLVNAAGISVYADQDGVIIPEKTGNTDAGKNYNGYISYADYAGTEVEVTGHYYSPYVTVNPNFRLTTDKLLTGDAVGKIAGDTYASVAARIWADNKTGATDKKNQASYPRASAIVNAAGKSEPVVSAFYAEQGCGPENLPVLVLKGADAGAIEDYLNVITNGGYSEAGVKPALSVYYYDEDTETFTYANDAELNSKNEPASIYLASDNKTMRVRNNSFDNTRNRFTLVEASFTVTVNGEQRIYTVSVPVVVIRELQYNFMSTFSYGAEFHAETFQNLKTHVLESTGNPFTAYLTYQYNHEEAKYVEYDWQSYMDDGGSMLNVDKVLSFSSGLPSGTQMTLIDCQNGNRAYQYTTTGTNTTAKTDVRLGSFISVSDGTPFQASMAEILGVASRKNESGNYVEVKAADPAEATVRLKNEAGGYTYYRPLASGETTQDQRYDLTVPDLSKHAAEENYYLVINVPGQGDGFYMNGSLSSALDWEMPSEGTWVHRYDGSSKNVGNNDESTYQISTGYRQELSSTAYIGTAVNLASGTEKMQVKAQDTITFSNQQVYGDNDQLFMKLTVDLQEHTADSQEVTEIQFPAGTTGKVYFYIQDTNGRYYLTNGNSWMVQTGKKEAASYDWVSQGANMELLLSEDGITALDLSGVRKLIKGNKSSGDSQIIVTAEMDIEFSGQEVLNATVPPSENNGSDTWVQLHYAGRISTQEFSLAYSSVRAAVNDNAKYYRGVKYEAILSMDAMSISQLGINPLELVPEYLTTFHGKKASRIDLMAALNLVNLQDIENVLANTKSITFTLSLQRGGRGSYSDVSDASDYVEIDLSSYDASNWSWIIQQDQFYKDGQIVTNDIFDGTQFTMPITAYVYTNQKNYANYEIKLTVQFEGSSVSVTDTEAYVVYTFACIKPEFYDPASDL